MKTGIFRGREQRQSSPAAGAHLMEMQHIGKYEVLREVASSKHARVKVFQAYDGYLERPVMLKVVVDGKDKHLADRFRREVSSVAKLRVPNVVAVYELGEQAGLPFAALQYLGDDNLEAAIQSNRTLAPLQRLVFLEQVAAGAAEAYRAGLPYVGLRPGGIALAADGSASIQDFGIVRAAGGSKAENRLYGAPEEQGVGFIPDLLCDVFSFGVICLEFLTGAHRSSEGEPALREPGALRQILPQGPESLERMVARLLQNQRELRYSSFDEIRDDLRPIVQALRRSRAAQLWTESRRLINSEKLEEAQELVREAVQLDPDDSNGQQISSDLRVLLQKQKLRTRIMELWRQADEAAGNRRFFAAVEVLESAERLDESDTETQARLEAMRGRLSRSLEVVKLTGEARLLMEQGEFEQARAKTLKALDCDGTDPEALELLESIREESEAFEREARTEKGVAQAKSLLLERSFDEALAILNGLRVENADSPLIQQWIGHAEAQKRAAERQERLQALTKQVESFFSQDRFAEAAALIEPEVAEFPGDRGLAELLARARGGVERVKLVEQTTARCNQLCHEHRFEQARDAVDRALADAPGEPALLSLRQKVDAQAQSYQRAASVREALEQVDWLTDQDRPDLAVRFLKEQLARIPNEPSLTVRLSDLETGLPDWELRRFVDVVEELAARRNHRGERQISESGLLPVLEEALRSAVGGYAVTDAAEQLRNSLRAEQILGQARRYLAFGKAEEAEQALREGIKLLPGPAANDLKAEIEACKKYAGERQTAEVLIGRRRLAEAQQLLQRLVKPDRPEVQELLDLVKELAAAGDEKLFYARVKETAVMLAAQGRREEADRLFRRLSALFPDEHMQTLSTGGARASRPAGQKDTQANTGAPEQRKPRTAAKPAETRPEPAPDRAVARRWWRGKKGADSRNWAAPTIALVSGMLVLTAAGAAVWRSSRAGVPAASAPLTRATKEVQRPPESAEVPLTPATAPSDQPLVPQQARLSSRITVSTSTASITRQKNSHEVERVAVRAFNAPVQNSPGVDRLASVDLPTPPSASAMPLHDQPGALAIGQGLASVPPPAAAPTKPALAEKASVPVHQGIVQPARLLTAPVPQFPALAVRNRVSGNVELEAIVDKQGRVKEITAVRGNPLLTSAARQAVTKWQYQPATVDGEAVEARVQITVRFSGSGK